MSSITFKSNEGRVLIGGRERARMGLLIDDLAWTMASLGEMSRSPQDDYNAKLAWKYSSDTNFSETLGWVCLIGNDHLKLLAHVHGQCEIHGWVHPDDGEWFASLVEGAVSDGLLGEDARGSYGTWQDVSDLARASESPLVSSYSVCDSWPSVYLIKEHRPDLITYVIDPDGDVDQTDELYEWFYNLPDEDLQRISAEAIADCAPRWHPAEWGTRWTDKARGRNPWNTEDNS